MNEKNSGNSSLIDAINDSFGIDKTQLAMAVEELKIIKESLKTLQPVSNEEADKVRNEIENDKKEKFRTNNR